MHTRSPLRPVLFVFLLSCTSTIAAQEPADVHVDLVSAVEPLPFRVTDAEFSTALDSIVAISDTQSQLHVYKPDTKEAAAVNLQLPPTCLSISPNGLEAVVGHNGWISWVNLSTLTLTKTIAVSADVNEIVHAGNGYAYVFEPGYFDDLRSVNLTTEAVTTSFGSRTPAAARLHPAGNRVYGADRNLSPDDIVRIDVTPAGPAGASRDSPYHGDYPFCGNVWISMDGLRLFTACGNVFRASDDPTQDMRFSGKLSEEVRIEWTSHSLSGNSVVVLPAFSQFQNPPRKDNEVHYYTHDFLLYRGKATLPSFAAQNGTWTSRGRWIFFNAAGTRQYVIVQADQASGLTLDYGVVTIDCTNAAVNLSPSSMTVGAAAGSAQFTVTGSAGCGWRATSNAPWITTISSGIGNGTVTFNVTENGSPTARSGTITVGSTTFTVTQNPAIPTSVIATATSPASISVAWGISGSSVDRYEVWRSTAGAPYELVGTPTSPSYADAAVSASTAYLYKVRSLLTGGGTTAFSPPDYAHTHSLTDEPLQVLTEVKAAHVEELRTVANALLGAVGLSPASFTDPSLAGVAVKAVHMTELRNALNAVRSTLGLSPVAGTPPSAGGVIAASHIIDLRTGAQ